MGRKSLTLDQVAGWLLKYFVISICFIAMMWEWAGRAEDSICAKVKIEIKQELTIERQAFDAHMRINNGLTNAALEKVKVDVLFTDEAGNNVLASSDPNNSSAVFFIRIDSMANITNVSGTGTVPRRVKKVNRMKA